VSGIEFTKLQGLGNDFLLIPVGDVSNLPEAPELARQMCERNYGAGADGVVFVARSSSADADFASRIFNADGSEARISGNGTRCAAAYLYYIGWCTEPAIRIATAAGIKLGRLIKREGVRFEFEFDMGEPRFSSRDVPMSIDPPLDRVVAYRIEAGDDRIEVTCLSMGNPQCVVFVPSLERVRLAELGPFIENHPIFPDRTNVEFAKVLSRNELEIRIWERGVGHTLSSGTGSCAAAVAAALNSLTDRKVKVHNEGGSLLVNWRDDNVVTLIGPAEVVYEGRWLR
jgi:diaminopimelate epimerase